MADRKVCVIGAGMDNWGVREASLVDLAQEAGQACFDDVPALKKEDVDGLLFASSYCGRCSFQVNAAPVMAERLGIKPTSICTRVDTLCAGGSSGIILAAGLIKAGLADVMMVAGGEKLESMPGHSVGVFSLKRGQAGDAEHNRRAGPAARDVTGSARQAGAMGVGLMDIIGEYIGGHAFDFSGVSADDQHGPAGIGGGDNNKTRVRRGLGGTGQYEQRQ